MYRLFAFFVSCLFGLYAVAQRDVIPKLEKEEPGKGKVNVLQDQRLTQRLNNPLLSRVEESRDDDAGPSIGRNTSLIPETRIVKARGYRIQVYWGGSKREDQVKARKVGHQVMNMFPELQAYTSYESPHWRCRVGDFATRQEANKYLSKINKANLSTGSMIVRSEIFIKKTE
jgi:hypothetical protein